MSECLAWPPVCRAGDKEWPGLDLLVQDSLAGHRMDMGWPHIAMGWPKDGHKLAMHGLKSLVAQR
jgi:hypothetical protein